MATVVHPGSGAVTATYAQIAKHFGVRVRPCPPRRGNRKGVVEKANHTAVQAQASLDEFCWQVTDQRQRLDQHGNRCTVAHLAAAEPLRPVPRDPPIAVTTADAPPTPPAATLDRSPNFAERDWGPSVSVISGRWVGQVDEIGGDPGVAGAADGPAAFTGLDRRCVMELEPAGGDPLQGVGGT